MKINSIKNISLNKTTSYKSNPIKSRQIPNDTFELSFGKRIKHSADFLEITRDVKNIRDSLTISCMMDEEGKFVPEFEDEFVELAMLYCDSDMDKETWLTTLALAFGAAKKLGAEEYLLENLTFFVNEIKELCEQGFSLKEVQSIFNWEEFDINSPKAFLILNDAFGEKMSLADKKIFLMKYCKDENWETDISRIPDVLKVFKIFGIDDLDEADVLYAMMYDDVDIKYNPDRCKFIRDVSVKLLKYAKQNDKNAIQMIKKQPREAKSLIYLLLNAILTSSQDKNGEFSLKKAKENFEDWFEYAKNNREEINSFAQIRTHNGDENYKYSTINEYIKKAPNMTYFVDNIIYRLSNVVSNTPQTFQ